jgi:ankyrin repeat protein
MKQHFLARMRAALDAIEQNAPADLARFEYVDLLTAQVADFAAPRDLFAAAAEGDVHTTRALLRKQGVDVDAENENGTSAMCVAAAHGHTEVITVLLDHGAGVNKADISNQTSLYLASVKGRVEALKVLIDRGGELNQAFVHPGGFTIRPSFHHELQIMDTPISAASSIGHTEVVEILLAAGADALRAGGYFGTPFLEAAGEGHSEIITLLLDHGGVDINQVVGEEHEEQPGATALLLASLEGHEETIKLLVKRGADVNKASTCGETPVAAASLGGYADAVHVLLKAGADANAMNGDCYTPLVGAAEGLHLDVIRVLAEVWPANPLAWRMFLMGGGAASELRDYLAPPANRATRNHLPRLYSKPDMMKEIYKYLHKPRYADLGQTDEDGRTALQHIEHTSIAGDGYEDVATLLRELSLG